MLVSFLISKYLNLFNTESYELPKNFYKVPQKWEKQGSEFKSVLFNE